MKKLIRRPAFYMMLLGTLFTSILSNLALPVVVPHLQDRGLTFGQASKLQSVLMLCLAGAKILTGYLCDTIGAKKTALLCIALDAVALVLLATSTGFVSAAVAVVVFAMALPLITVTVPLLASALFGYQAQGSYTGIFISMVSASAILANPIANIVYDYSGTYSTLFLIAAAAMAVIFGMYLLMYRLAERDRKSAEAIEE
jgi:MFS family permease